MALAAMLRRRGRWIVKVNRDLVLDCNFGERARLVDRTGVAERQGSSSAAATFGLVGRRLSRPCRVAKIPVDETAEVLDVCIVELGRCASFTSAMSLSTLR